MFDGKLCVATEKRFIPASVQERPAKIGKYSSTVTIIICEHSNQGKRRVKRTYLQRKNNNPDMQADTESSVLQEYL